MLADNLKKHTLVLASQSPRRKELLEGMKLPFVVEKPVTEENNPSNLDPVHLVEHLANQKAEAISPLYNLENAIIIGGDTIVCIDNLVLGKPKDEEGAKNMLKQLSGKKHTVISGLCLLHKEKTICCHDITDVYFKDLSIDEIEYYVSSYKPFDKAGAYGIQEWIGYTAINRIEGSYYNVMGLPTHLLWEMLEEILK
jgi:septum formation protein